MPIGHFSNTAHRPCPARVRQQRRRTQYRPQTESVLEEHFDANICKFSIEFTLITPHETDFGHFVQAIVSRVSVPRRLGGRLPTTKAARRRRRGQVCARPVQLPLTWPAAAKRAEWTCLILQGEAPQAGNRARESFRRDQRSDQTCELWLGLQSFCMPDFHCLSMACSFLRGCVASNRASD